MMTNKKIPRLKVIIISSTTAMFLLFASIHVRPLSDYVSDYRRGRSCDCSKRDLNPPAYLNLSESTCSHYAAQKGPGQRVVSFSFFVTLNSTTWIFPGYFQGIEANAMNLPEYYPGWTMRVYHNISRKDNEIHSLFCQLECRFPYLDFCNVSETPIYGNVNEWTPATWRFLPLGDPQVDYFVSRDLDSRFSDRELAAVEEWIQSGKTWHSMRDHPEHIGVPILAGMWGANIMRNRDLMRRVLDDLFRLPVHYNRDRDQEMLHEAVWPHYEGDSVRHDSYHCREFPSNDVRPYPTPRRNDTDLNFVASRPAYREKVTEICPIECRPKNHQDWLLC